MKVLEFINTIKDAKKKEIFKRKVMGDTINKIKKDLALDISNERIRQIYLSVIREKRVELEEDKYKEVFKKYYFSKKDFMEAFKEHEPTFNYLLLHLKRGSLPMLELENDLSFPKEITKCIKSLRKKREKETHFNFNGEIIFKNRRSVADYIVKTYFKEEGSIYDFERVYNEFLKENNLHENKNYAMNSRSYENVFLNESEIALWKQWRRFRYYDIKSYDFTNLWEDINIEKYENMEIGAKKIWLDNKVLMEKYDIRDEYELHNLLRKLCNLQQKKGISFGKMPIIMVGNPNRKEQVLELVKELSPIKAIDFARAYEEKYGVYANTVLGSFVRSISSYFYNGIYDSEEQLTPLDDELEVLKQILKEDYYEINDVKRIYKSKFKTSDEKNINSFSLTKLGFRVKEGYIIKEHFSSSSAYFKSIIYPFDYVDTKKFPSYIRNKSSYISALESLRSEYKILELEEGKYSSIDCQEKEGITIPLIKDYVKAVNNHIKGDEFFTIKTLLDSGFTHKLHDLNKSERFYSFLIIEDRAVFSYRTIGTVRVMRKGKHNIFIEYLLEYIFENEVKKEDITTTNIMKLLEEKYGMKNPSRHKVNKFISSYNLKNGL